MELTPTPVRLDSTGNSFDGSLSSSDDRDSSASPMSFDREKTVNPHDPSPIPEDPDLPRSLIVTNVHKSVFEGKNVKVEFESLFREFDSECIFYYLPSFRRIRVSFDSHLAASRAKAHLDKYIVQDCIIHCYFLQILLPTSGDGAHLRLPARKRQFLISPPSSPPVGWEQPAEDKPIVDESFLDALAKLNPGERCELVPRKRINILGKSVSTPSIVVQLEQEVGTVEGVQQSNNFMDCPPSTCSPGSIAPLSASVSLDESDVNFGSDFNSQDRTPFVYVPTSRPGPLHPDPPEHANNDNNNHNCDSEMSEY